MALAASEVTIQHTPGPWTFVGSAIEADSPSRPGFTDVIAWVSADIEEVNADANGRLIAAAPLLLQALRDCETEIKELMSGTPLLSWSVPGARAAIAVATSKSQP